MTGAGFIKADKRKYEKDTYRAMEQRNCRRGWKQGEHVRDVSVLLQRRREARYNL